MDPRRLLTFRTVAHERSFSKAATVLSLSQPSVSHQIAQLETEAGVRLLERGRGGVQLTPAGAVLLEHADHLAWRLDLARDQVADLAAQRRRDVRIGCFPTALAGFLPSALTHLAADDLRFRLSEVTPSTLEPRLLGGEFDVALSYQDATAARVEIGGARRIDLLHDTFLVGLAPDHRLAGDPGPVELADLAGDDWIFPSLEGFLLEACRQSGFDPHIVAVTDDPLTTRGLIAHGLGVGWVPNLLINDYAGVTIRPLATPLRSRDVFAFLPPGETHPLAHTVIAALRETAPQFGRPSAQF